MTLRDSDMPLDPEAERELAAVDAGLMGLDVAPDVGDIADLAREARELRQDPRPDFAAGLDDWAAAGFPRDGRPTEGPEGRSGPALGGLVDRVRAVPTRRLLAPAGAVATLLVAVIVGVSVSDRIGGPDEGAGDATSISSLPSQNEGGDEAQATVPKSQQEAQAPSLGSAQRLEDRTTQGFRTAAPGATRTAPDANASGRKVAQSADLVLSTEPRDVRNVADDVVRVVDRYGGYVVSSNVTSGRTPAPVPVPMQEDAGRLRAQQGSGSFELRIPARSLQRVLADLSGLAHVASRTEGTIDITKRFDTAKARVHDLQVQREHLLRQLAEAFTVEEQESLEARLEFVERRLADARDHFGHVQNRVRLVPVSVQVVGERGVDAGDGGGGGSWSIDDALHSAGRVLTVIAGILLISAAVLAPLALLGALAWITARAVIRRRREDALD